MTTNYRELWKELESAQERPPRSNGQLDIYREVPIHSIEANLDYRGQIIDDARKSPSVARAVREMCAQDFNYFVRLFGWLVEPRSKSGESQIPFLPYPKQDEILWKMDGAFGSHNLLGDKSRDVGFSWMMCYKMFHAWEFSDADMGILSKDEDAVDDPGNQDSLLPKLDIIYEAMPSFLQPKRTRSFGKMINKKTGASIIGEAPTPTAFSGGRKKMIGWDEMAKCKLGWDTELYNSLLRVTDCIFMVSTLYKPFGEYFNLREACLNDPVPPAEYIAMNWKHIAHKRKNLYTAVSGVLIKIDPNFNLPANYPYILDGRVRSPYYDKEWHRARGNAKYMDREFDQNIQGLSDRFFDEANLKQLMRKCVEPHTTFIISKKDKKTPATLHKNPNGPLAVWGSLDNDNTPPITRFIIACDISSGLGTSATNNSVAHVLQASTGEQVAEYVTNIESPKRFARKVYALAKMYHDALVGWESNGAYATQFKRELMGKLGYGKVWRHVDTSGSGDKRTNKIGWHNAKQGKEDLFTPWADDLYGGLHVVRSLQLLREAKNYIFSGGGVQYANTSDDTEADKNQAHGDRVIAGALAWMIYSSRTWDTIEDVEYQERQYEKYDDDEGLPLIASSEQRRDSLFRW